MGIYYSAFQWLVIKDWGREDYNYGYLIPAVALYLIWEKWKAFQSTETPTVMGRPDPVDSRHRIVLDWVSFPVSISAFTYRSWLVFVGIMLDAAGLGKN